MMKASRRHGNCIFLTAVVFLFVLAGNRKGIDSKKLRIGALIPWNGSWPAGPRLASAIIVAIEKVRDLNLLPGYNLTYIWKDSFCQIGPSLRALSDLRVLKPSIDVFIGPACSMGCTSCGFLAAHWDLPMISYGCIDEDLSDKSSYPTFVRTVGPFSQSGNLFLLLMKQYGWNRIAILTSTEPVWSQLASLTKRKIESKPEYKVSYFESFSPDIASDVQYQRMIQSARKKAHVFIFACYGPCVRQVALNLLDMGMITSEYAYFTYFTLSQTCKGGSDGRDAEACRAFEGLIDIGVYNPDTVEHRSFKAEVRRRMPEFAGLGYNMRPSDEVDEFAGFLHDSVLLYALALNDTIRAGGNITSGRDVARQMINRSFEGVSGILHVDQNGDRYLAFQMTNVQNGEMVKVAEYYSWNQKLIMSNTTIYWPGGGTATPLGRPLCGFDNEYCPTPDIMKIVIYVLVAILAVLLIVIAVAIYMKKKLFESSLNSELWRVKAEEVTFTKKLIGSSHSRRSIASSAEDLGSMYSQVINTKDDFQRTQIFATVAIYKSTLAAVKKLRKTSINLNRTVLLELKQALDVQHPNINRFIGACVDTSKIWILTQYCNKGSLQDVLNNSDIKLDWMFQISFASDIARGMGFLHKSPIGYHGHLKSSNCVIDSRWVCKITDHGLRKFCEDQTPDPELGVDTMYNQLLWTAPEHLSDPERPGQSPKGDVYSYGIILQEILLRGLPYCVNEFMEAKAIVNRVRQGEIPPFRPIVPPESGSRAYIKLMAECWNELPGTRPGFTDILRKLKNINKGKEINIMDNMIAMMEKYTDNLEEVVQERTQQLEDEKLKTDELLYRMLPRSVADKLKVGAPVDAELFESVTILFSDIVAFTKLASESTPIQVVNLLNDLYTCFDKIIDSHDVYKVETIGDSYMVVSGIPKRNGIQHAGEIANMSLDLLSDMTDFKIRHKPHQQLQLRIGIHSGSCVAGVVGLKMPRYCLFGDTVNVSSRMESSGLALRIHISMQCKALLDKIGGYQTFDRGLISIKGKGQVRTFFLNGRDGFSETLPDLLRAANIEDHDFK